MKRMIGLGGGLVAAVGLLLVPGSAAATTCPPDGSTLVGALVVAPGTSCEIDGVSVGGGVSVGKEAVSNRRVWSAGGPTRRSRGASA